MAMSNPCFEIWLIMHLKDIREFSEDEKQLILKNEKISNSKNYIDKVLGKIQGRGYNKRPNPKIFLPKTRTAINLATELDNPSEAYPKSLGSHVYKLVKKLLKE